MPRYEHSAEIEASPDALFAYLSDVRNLPKYFDRMTMAEPAGGERIRTAADLDGKRVEGEAWFRVDRGSRTLAWGSEGPNDYHGELDVSGEGNPSRVAVRLFTEARHPGIDDGLRTTVATIKRLVEEEGRAIPPDALAGTGVEGGLPM